MFVGRNCRIWNKVNVERNGINNLLHHHNPLITMNICLPAFLTRPLAAFCPVLEFFTSFSFRILSPALFIFIGNNLWLNLGYGNDWNGYDITLAINCPASLTFLLMPFLNCTVLRRCNILRVLGWPDGLWAHHWTSIYNKGSQLCHKLYLMLKINFSRFSRPRLILLATFTPNPTRPSYHAPPKSSQFKMRWRKKKDKMFHYETDMKTRLHETVDHQLTKSPFPPLPWIHISRCQVSFRKVGYSWEHLSHLKPVVHFTKDFNQKAKLTVYLTHQQSIHFYQDVLSTTLSQLCGKWKVFYSGATQIPRLNIIIFSTKWSETSWRQILNLA